MAAYFCSDPTFLKVGSNFIKAYQDLMKNGLSEDSPKQSIYEYSEFLKNLNTIAEQAFHTQADKHGQPDLKFSHHA